MSVDPLLLIVVVTAALVSALNPCTIGILTMLLTVVMGKGHHQSRMFWLGFAYLVSLMSICVVIGALVLYMLHALPLVVAEYLVIGLGLLVVNAGLLEIKYYLWYGEGIGLRLGPKATAYLTSLGKGHISVKRAIWLGLCTGIVCLPSTGAAYVAVVSLLRNDFTYTSLSLLGLFNLLLVLPMVLLLGMLASGYSLSAVQRWKEDAKGTMRLGTGLLLIVLGWIIVLTANGIVNLS